MGGGIRLTDSLLSTSNLGSTDPGPGRGIAIRAGELKLSNSIVESSTSRRDDSAPSGKTAPIVVETSGALDIGSCAQLECGGNSDGDSYLSSSTSGAGDAGGVTVTTGGNLTIRVFIRIFSQAEKGSTGAAGTVTVESKGDMIIESGGLISTSTFAANEAGVLKATAHGRLTINGNGIFPTGITAQTNLGSTGKAFSDAE